MAKRLVIGLLLVSMLLACIYVVQCLSTSAPAVRWRLARSVRSLPAAPQGVTLLGQGEGDASGSDCVAYYVDEIYGTYKPLDEVVRYYRQKLSEDGWTQFPNYIPDGAVAAEFRRGDDEFLRILTPQYVHFDSAIRKVPPERRTQFETVYILRVVRTCGGGPTELRTHPRSP